MAKEFNLRERAEIVMLAIKASKSLNSEELIKYFSKKYEDEKHTEDLDNVNNNLSNTYIG
jgi:hypothetical protein